jgi:hypothetical protein
VWGNPWGIGRMNLKQKTKSKKRKASDQKSAAKLSLNLPGFYLIGFCFWLFAFGLI